MTFDVRGSIVPRDLFFRRARSSADACMRDDLDRFSVGDRTGLLTLAWASSSTSCMVAERLITIRCSRADNSLFPFALKLSDATFGSAAAAARMEAGEARVISLFLGLSFLLNESPPTWCDACLAFPRLRLVLITAAHVVMVFWVTRTGTDLLIALRTSAFNLGLCNTAL